MKTIVEQEKCTHVVEIGPTPTLSEMFRRQPYDFGSSSSTTGTGVEKGSTPQLSVASYPRDQDKRLQQLLSL